MSQQHNLTAYQKQKNAKPKIEDAINDLLRNDRKKAATEFLAFLHTNKMTPQWASFNAWSVKFKGKPVCSIKFFDHRLYTDKSTWRICHSGDYVCGCEDLLSEENMKRIVYDHVYFCRKCAGTRAVHSICTSIFGKKFNDVCLYFKIQFENPDQEILMCAKDLVRMRRKAILEIIESK